MKLADAKPGDILQDRDGAVWLIGKSKALCIYNPETEPGGESHAVEDAAEAILLLEVERWGPFTRIVPEQEHTDALRPKGVAAEAQADCDAAHEREDWLRGENTRLHSELDALHAIVESGCDLDAEVVAGVQAARDDLRGLAGKVGA